MGVGRWTPGKATWCEGRGYGMSGWGEVVDRTAAEVRLDNADNSSNQRFVHAPPNPKVLMPSRTVAATSHACLACQLRIEFGQAAAALRRVRRQRARDTRRHEALAALLHAGDASGDAGGRNLAGSCRVGNAADAGLAARDTVEAPLGRG